MYKNHVEFLRGAGDCNKNRQENLVNIKSERNYIKESSTQDLNKDLQHRSNKDLTQKLNVVNEFLATKEASEYDQIIHLKSPDLFQHQAQV